MRTDNEILKRIEQRKCQDYLGFEWPEYLAMLPFDKAKPYLKPEYDGKNWSVKTPEEIRAKAIDYMPFAWYKANNCRGISSIRSLSHYIAWLWLLGEDGFDDLEDFEFYGKPQLTRICEFFGLDPKQWDDGVRRNTDD